MHTVVPRPHPRWREAPVDIVQIGEDAAGRTDLSELTRKLTAYADRPLKVHP